MWDTAYASTSYRRVRVQETPRKRQVDYTAWKPERAAARRAVAWAMLRVRGTEASTRRSTPRYLNEEDLSKYRAPHTHAARAVDKHNLGFCERNPQAVCTAEGVHTIKQKLQALHRPRQQHKIIRIQSQLNSKGSNEHKASVGIPEASTAGSWLSTKLTTRSKNNPNKSGDIGQPCLTPMVMPTRVEEPPTVPQTSTYILRIHSTMLGDSPKWERSSSISAERGTVSNAFSRSTNPIASGEWSRCARSIAKSNNSAKSSNR